MDFIDCKNAPPPNGHYSHATIANGFIFTSIQLPIDIDNHLYELSIENQTEKVLENLLYIVKAAGGDIGAIAKVTIYTTDMSNWDAINRTFHSFMGSHRPARGIVNVSRLHLGFSVAADAIAVLKS